MFDSIYLTIITPYMNFIMKYKQHIVFSFLAIVMVWFFVKPNNQQPDPQKEVLLLQTVMQGLNQLHYSPTAINDEFSKDLLKSYLDVIDGGKRFLIQSEVDELKKSELNLDDEISAGNLSFFNKTLALTDASFDRVERIIGELSEKPFEFNTDEYIETDPKKRSFSVNEAELKESWRKLLKYEIMTKLADKIEERTKGSAEYKDKTDAQFEEDARKQVKDRYTESFSRFKKLKREERFADFLNTIANIFDPHTEYYQPVEKQSFDIKFSGRLEGIGATLQSEKEYTKISDIIAGGPAWKQKELKVGDVITKVAQGDEEPINIGGMNLNEVVSKIRGPKGTKVRLTVNGIDGVVKEVVIIREEIIIEEGYAKSVILENKDKLDNIGLINLPRFYADFQKRDGRQCFEDVAKEIEKLKATGVKGIIIDLRNNGGGSLNDVVKMTGLFIEQGPIVQVKAKEGRPDIQRDYDVRVQYDGPLIIMVNQFSASASEIMAAALQDYKRAIVIGSKQTYGKGTVQRFFDLDNAINGYENMKPLGDMKVSLQKFYRINGGSTQLKGVVPDIQLPDDFQSIELGERESDHAMAWSQIDPVEYTQNAYKIKDLKSLTAKSKERISKNETFNKVAENAKRLKTQRDQSRYSLKLTEYMADLKSREAEAKAYKGIADKELPNLLIKNMQADLSQINADSTKINRNIAFLKDLKSDAQIEEAMNIMKDMISQSMAAKN